MSNVAPNIDGFFAYSNSASPNAVVATTQSGATPAQLAATVSSNKYYAGFSTDGKIYRLLDDTGAFTTSNGVHIYYKKITYNNMAVAPAFGNAGAYGTPFSADWFSRSYPPGRLATKAVSDAVGGMTALDLLDGAWFLWRVYPQSGGSYYVRFLPTRNVCPNDNAFDLVPASDHRNHATAFQFRITANGNGNLYMDSDLDFLGTPDKPPPLILSYARDNEDGYRHPSGNYLHIVNAGTYSASDFTQFSVSFDAASPGHAVISTPIGSSTNTRGLTVAQFCNGFLTLFANSAWTPLIEQDLEIIVPGINYQPRDYIVNGPGKYLCCGSSIGSGAGLAQLCTTLGYTPLGNNTCQNLMNVYCKLGSNFVSQECTSFCTAQDGNKYTQCDDMGYAYCRSIPVSQAIVTPQCGCFMSDAFYSDYYNQIYTKFPALQGVVSQRPFCSYAKCAQATVLNDNQKTHAAGDCPNQAIAVCLQNLTINNDGTINGNLTTEQQSNCNAAINSTGTQTRTRTGTATTTNTGTGTGTGTGAGGGANSAGLIIGGAIAGAFVLAVIIGLALRRKRTKQ